MKITLIGPFPPPITGVSLANEVLFEGLLNSNISVKKINTDFNKDIDSKHGKLKINKFLIIKSFFEFNKIINTNIIYITIGQSFFGVLKYIPFLLTAKLFRKKTAVHLHGGHLYNEYCGLSSFKKIIFKQTMRMFDYGIVLSESLKINLQKFLNPENVYSLNNFYQDELRMEEEDFFNKDFSKIKMVYLSNLIKEKGINNLLEAKKKLSERGINFDLKIAGSIISANDLNKQFSYEGVSYLGNVSGEKKKQLLQWSNVFCLPTYYNMEGQPISIIEAMATANLILTTKHAGIVDICSDKNAVFCNKNDVNNLVETIEYIHNNSKIIKEISFENYKYASTKFTEKEFVDNAIKIFKQCMI